MKLQKTIFLPVVICITLIHCSKDGTPNQEPEPEPPKYVCPENDSSDPLIRAKMIGQWKIDSFFFFGYWEHTPNQIEWYNNSIHTSNFEVVAFTDSCQIIRAANTPNSFHWGTFSDVTPESFLFRIYLNNSDSIAFRQTSKIVYLTPNRFRWSAYTQRDTLPNGVFIQENQYSMFR